eukprot:TRINITY_DN14324_c0_g1_i5.p1 TRINITY_DN14324_c0_g1~~TRINITY_DN14324_c0_g1_i5.p1  ORF type:complete len:301 (-),score=54.60 TRINITY_DN14324_c0_g1_i5:113-1015(-)
MGCTIVKNSGNTFNSAVSDSTEEYIHYLSKNRRNWRLILYTLKDKAFTTLKIEDSEIVKKCESVIVNGKIYCTGGSSKSNSVSDEVCVISFQKKSASVRHLSSMNYSRYKHTFISISLNCLLVMGGVGSKSKAVLDCETYNIFSNRWSRMGKLNHPRTSAAAACLNGKVVYIFGGLKGINTSQFVEYMKVGDNRSEWKVVDVKVSEECLQVRRLWCTQVSSSEIILFWKSETAIFDTKANKFVLDKDQTNQEYTLPDKREEIRKYGDKIAMILEATGNVGIYSLETKKWTVEPHIVLDLE